MEELELTPETPAEEAAPEVVSMDALLPRDAEPAPPEVEDAQLLALLEAVVYVAEEPLTLAQIAAGLAQPVERVEAILRQLTAEFDKPEHGIAIREVAGGFKMATKAEHHETVRNFVKSLKPPLKLSLPALETLAVIAYKQPVTAPEVNEIRGVDSSGVFGSLLSRKLIATAGRKQVIGRPILYKTTKEFLLRFGLKDVSELPSMEEFEKIAAIELDESAPTAEDEAAAAAAEAAEPQLDLPEGTPEASEPRSESYEPEAASTEPEATHAEAEASHS